MGSSIINVMAFTLICEAWRELGTSNATPLRTLYAGHEQHLERSTSHAADPALVANDTLAVMSYSGQLWAPPVRSTGSSSR